MILTRGAATIASDADAIVVIAVAKFVGVHLFCVFLFAIVYIYYICVEMNVQLFHALKIMQQASKQANNISSVIIGTHSFGSVFG